jgi:hypothetical protein
MLRERLPNKTSAESPRRPSGRRRQVREKAMVFETYTRVFVDAEALDQISAFYRSLLAGEETLRFAYPEAHLELAAVSSPRL